MIYLDLLIGFFYVGCFSFGGAYSAIPLIRDVVLSYGWLTDEAIAAMIAVSESTPGPIMVNLATYVGSSQGGVLGAFLATFGVILPAFLIILLVMVALKSVFENRYVKAVLAGLKPCIIGIILATGAYMIFSTCLPSFPGVDGKALLITGLLIAASFAYRRFRKKKLSPILLIVISAFLGMLIYGIS